MFERLLIANRGEIAVRVARTAARLGIETVGVYSEPDRDALHVDAVDLAVALGGTTPAESYLRVDALLEAASTTGCDVVHPGYGFLAENAAFARAVLDAGLTWVGPTPDQIALLGDKVAAKRVAIVAGVPTAPIFDAAPGALPAGIPLPALVKAAAGGGGRGMRIVRSEGELAEAVEAAAREAASAFGDGTVFVEPYIERGRHVEVQILGDHHGNVIHLGERECSVQRRNQKIVEESPSAGIDPATRAVLCDGALALARHVGYRNAGTVEFLVGADATVNFLEVNTRLQVEHPVTEAVTGLDLVELQLRVAAGEPLPLGQEDVVVTGHAVEVRLVAEDPAAGWLPSTGRIERFEIGDGVRVDAGVRRGSEVSADYDSLLAKLIAHAPTRAEAARELARALQRARLVGPRTNADTLVALLGEPDFLAAATPTSYFEDHPAVLTAVGPTGDDRLALLLAAALVAADRHRAADRVWGFAPSGWRNLRTQGQRQVWLDEATGHEERIEYVVGPHGRVDVLVGPWPVPTDDGSLSADERRSVAARVIASDGERLALEVDGVRRRVEVSTDSVALHVAGPGGRAAFRSVPRFVDHDAELVAGGPVAPLPGTVIAVHVTTGAEVEEGEVLLVLEAMKMEHKIASHGAATVTEVLVAVGDRVDAGDLLVHLEAKE